MSQSGTYLTGSTPPPGTYIEQLQGDLGLPVNGLLVLILGEGTVAPVTLNNSGIIFTGDGVNVLNATLQYLNMPDTDTSGNGILYFNSIPYLQNYGVNNLFIGANAGNTTLTVLNSAYNIGIGTTALAALTDGAANIAMGYLSLNLCDTGSGNTAIGFEVLPQITSGSGNVGVGENCMNSLVGAASENTCLGSATLSGMTSGSNNIAIGYGTGQAYNGAQSSNILIGPSSLGAVGDSNTIRIGETGTGAGQQNRFFAAAIDGVDVGSTAKVVTMGTAATVDQLGTATITAGTGITITPTANTITIAASGGGAQVITYTAVSSTPYVVLSTDCFLGVDSSGGARTIQLPNAPTTGQVFYIKDSNGTANTNNITVTTVGGAVNIDGATTYVMNTQYSAISVIFNGTAYLIF